MSGAKQLDVRLRKRIGSEATVNSPNVHLWKTRMLLPNAFLSYVLVSEAVITALEELL